MVLHSPGCGRVGRRRTPFREEPPRKGWLFVFPDPVHAHPRTALLGPRGWRSSPARHPCVHPGTAISAPQGPSTDERSRHAGPRGRAPACRDQSPRDHTRAGAHARDRPKPGALTYPRVRVTALPGRQSPLRSQGSPALPHPSRRAEIHLAGPGPRAPT